MNPRDDVPHAKPEQAHILVHFGFPCPIGGEHAGDDGVLAAILPDSGCDPYNGKYSGKQRKQHGTQAERQAPAAALHFCDVLLHRRAPARALGLGQGNWQCPGLSLSLPTTTGFPSSACFANRPHAELVSRM